MIKKMLLLIMSLLFVMGFSITASAAPAEDVISELKGLLEGQSSEEIDEMISFIKEKLAAGELSSDEDIQDAIKEGEEKFDVSLTEEDKEKVLQVIQKVKDLGLDPEKLLDQAKDLYDKFGDELVDNAEEVIKDSFKESISNFFTDLGSTVKNFFANLFS